MATWQMPLDTWMMHPPKKRPGSLFPTSRAVILATSYSRTTYRRTTIGAAAFHFRVRNGNGWGHCAMITRDLTRISGQISADRCTGQARAAEPLSLKEQPIL